MRHHKPQCDKTFFRTEKGSVRFIKENCAFYFQIGTNDIRGPFIESCEAYQECIKDLMVIIEDVFSVCEKLETKAVEILELIAGEVSIEYE